MTVKSARPSASRLVLAVIIAGLMALGAAARLHAATVSPDPGSASYQQGSADRDSWEAWFNSLSGPEFDGANYWAAQRSSKAPVPCGSYAQYGSEWMAGCTEAKRRLFPSDIKRKTDPQYWNGWNKIGTTPPTARTQEQAAGDIASHDLVHSGGGWLGVRIQQVTTELAESVGLKSVAGVMVVSVIDGSPADKAKIKSGDIILTFDGQAVSNAAALPQLLANTASGKPVRVVLWRDGREINVAAVLDEKPNDTKAAPSPPQPASPSRPAPPSETQSSGSGTGTGVGVAVLALVGLCLFLYFLPSIIGISRGINADGALFFVNLLFGWTVLGWFICLIWAATGATKAQDAFYRKAAAQAGPDPTADSIYQEAYAKERARLDYEAEQRARGQSPDRDK